MSSSKGPSVTTTRFMQGQVEDGKKNSLDSDDEDEEAKELRSKTMKNVDEVIEGQEDETLRNDGEIAITPFNLKDEQLEGDFTTEGDFIWKKKDDEILDSWLDNVDWNRVQERTETKKRNMEEDNEVEDEAEAAYDEHTAYKAILELIKPGETVGKALRRLGGGGNKKSSADRWKRRKKQPDEPENEKDKLERENREKMLKLTGLADSVLSRSGNMEVYEETYEKIAFKLKSTNNVVPEEDALDMFASKMDDKEKEEPVVDKANETKEPKISDVQWEFKWEDKKEAKIHGPHSSKEMLEWQQSGFFEKGVLVRKFGSDSDFSSSKRIDFELYT